MDGKVLKRDRQLLPLSSINFKRTVLRSQKELGAHIWTAIGSQVIFSVRDLRWSRTATINQDNLLLLTHYFFVDLHIIQ